MSRNVFVYGTLRFPQLMSAVTGRRPPARPARLDGYARYRVRREPCPGIVACPDSSVEGWLYPGIDPSLMPIIDDYEGEIYEREAVTVRRLDDGRTLPAETYVIPPRRRTMLTDEDWDPDAFARHWLRHYVRLARAWRREFDT